MMKSLLTGFMVLTLCFGATTAFASAATKDIGLKVGDAIEMDGREY